MVTVLSCQIRGMVEVRALWLELSQKGVIEQRKVEGFGWPASPAVLARSGRGRNQVPASRYSVEQIMFSVVSHPRRRGLVHTTTSFMHDVVGLAGAGAVSQATLKRRRTHSSCTELTADRIDFGAFEADS